MRKYIFIISIAAVVVMSEIYLKANQDSTSDKNSKTETTKHEEYEGHKKDEEDEHKHAGDESKEHGHGDKHAQNEEENPQVGPSKGILAASEDEGIKLSSEAEKNFEIQKLKVLNPSSIEIPGDALVTAGVEVNLYRYRAGFYKRIDFEQLSRSKNKISIRSRDLQRGDEVAITGLGFLRIAEIAAFGGAPEGHSH